MRWLLLLLCTTPLHAEETLSSRIKKSLKLMQHSAETYISNRTCFSCHHQALPALTVSLAREHGFDIDRKKARAQSQFTIRYFSKRITRLVKGNGVPGGSYNAGYTLLSLHADEWKADKTTDALVQYLLKRHENGFWKIITRRPPLEASHFTATALAIRALRLYAKDQSAIESPINQAKQWLIKTKAKSNEDQSFQILGLKWSHATPQTIEPFKKALLKSQREDGGWAQLPKMKSDAYATGQALVALHEAGVKPDHEQWRKGIAFLIRNQLDDGSWKVESRSKPFQKYFESGFPHKKNQWISITASSWATQALILSMPKGK